jgi:hypothetical protein
MRGSLGEILRLTQTRALTLIRYHKTTRYVTEAELLSDVNFKLLWAVNKFDPAKGSAFTFVSHVITNVLCTAVAKTKTATRRSVELDEGVTNNLLTNGESQSRDVIDDLTYRIKAGARTTLTDPTELSAQRWYIASFLADGSLLPDQSSPRAATPANARAWLAQ